MSMSSIEWLAWLLLLLLIVRITQKLQAIHLLLRPDAPPPPSVAQVPALVVRKLTVFLQGVVYLFLSRDKVTKKQVRVIFVRHGESVWNYVFNRGFGPSFIYRLISTLLYELYLLPLFDSAFLDSPLSQLGLEQCAGLQDFLHKPCIDPAARDDFESLVNGESRSLLVSSQLRRACATLAIALDARISRSHEPILLHSSCQEITRNVDSQSISTRGGAPVLYGCDELERPLHLDGTFNRGNKSLAFTGVRRLNEFARWAADRPEQCIVVAGHSLWFRTFFQLFLPKQFEHISKKSKIVNCGAVGFTLQTGLTAEGALRHRIEPDSLRVIYGGFDTK